MINEIGTISATTFQLKHTSIDPNKFKCTFDIGDEVESPLGMGNITWLDKETGECRIKLIQGVSCKN